MDAQVQKRSTRFKKTDILIISLITFILLMLAVAAQFTYSLLNYEGIYKGVSINNLNVGGFSLQQAEELLVNNYGKKADELSIELKAGNETLSFKFTEIGFSYDFGNSLKNAFSVGREGNIFKKFSQIFLANRKGINFELLTNYDRNKVEEFANLLYEKTFIPVKEADLFIQDDEVIIRTGQHGENIDREALIKEICSLVESRQGGVIEVPIQITNPNGLDIDDLLSQINSSPVDASFKVENNKVSILPHVNGRSIDKKNLESIIARIKDKENKVEVLPVEIVKPNLTTSEAKDALFRDKLAYMSTWFSTDSESNKRRGENIRLATEKINGTVLAPGDEFSFNDVVGPRTEETGYQSALVFVAGEIVDGIGGGICQVSSTLYNAVLYADLEVLERRNHMFTVAYVPYGRDATVAYGAVDFRFRNNTGFPIRIDAEITPNNTVDFTLVGTEENPGKTIEIVPEVRKTTPFEIKYIDDPNLPENQEIVKQNGYNGYVVDTYKIVKQNGKIISQEKISTSTYRTLEKQIIRGTRKVEQSTEPPVENGLQAPAEEQRPAGDGNADPGLLEDETPTPRQNGTNNEEEQNEDTGTGETEVNNETD
jgi:vancomycin resistance protein YoaR